MPEERWKHKMLWKKRNRDYGKGELSFGGEICRDEGDEQLTFSNLRLSSRFAFLARFEQFLNRVKFLFSSRFTESPRFDKFSFKNFLFVKIQSIF